VSSLNRLSSWPSFEFVTQDTKATQRIIGNGQSEFLLVCIPS